MKQYLPLLALLASCATTPKTLVRDDCPMVQVFAYGQEVTDEDREILASSKLGCVRRYGPGACLVEFHIRGNANYYVLCRRAQ